MFLFYSVWLITTVHLCVYTQTVFIVIMLKYVIFHPLKPRKLPKTLFFFLFFNSFLCNLFSFTVPVSESQFPDLIFVSLGSVLFTVLNRVDLFSKEILKCSQGIQI